MEKTKDGNKINKALLMGTALVSLSALPASDVKAAAGTVDVSAIILTPIVVASPTDLHFGSLTVAAGSAGTAVVGATNNRSVTGGVSEVTGGPNPHTTGILNITAAPTSTVDITVDAGPFTVSNGAVTMVVDTFNLATDAGGGTASLAIPAGGTATMPVGATLNVGAAQATGTYTGNFTVTVSYQ